MLNFNDIGGTIEINQHISSIIASSLNESEDVEQGGSQLDLHANMIVMGKHSYIISKSGLTANVNAFSQEVGCMLEVPIVDTLMVYECPYTAKLYFLVARNVLYVESMDHNLIPPFILREAGLEVNDRAKIHSYPTTKDDHSNIDPKSDMHIRLQLDGIFSKFDTRAPTNSDLFDKDVTIVVITPEGPMWDPNSSTYGENEESMIDSAGDLINETHNTKAIIDENDNEGLNFNELENYDFNVQSIFSKQVEIEATKILDKELSDLTFNGPSDIYTTFEAATISATSANSIKIDGLR